MAAQYMVDWTAIWIGDIRGMWLCAYKPQCLHVAIAGRCLSSICLHCLVSCRSIPDQTGIPHSLRPWQAAFYRDVYGTLIQQLECWQIPSHYSILYLLTCSGMILAHIDLCVSLCVQHNASIHHLSFSPNWSVPLSSDCNLVIITLF